MKLTDELYEIGKNSKNICTYIDDDYVLLKKKMPIEDDKLENYISLINRAHENGINIAPILDYRLIGGTTSCEKYTTGVFLEQRAKGLSSRNISSMYLETKNNYNFNDVSKEYLNEIEVYLNELEEKNKGSQEIYNKLVKDCLELNNYGLTIDPKPLNFFYDNDKGYTIIDVITSDKKEIDNIYFPRYIFSVVFGYHKTIMFIGAHNCSIFPLELKDRYEKCIKELSIKIMTALRINRINKISIEKEHQYSMSMLKYDEYIKIDDISNCLTEKYKQVKELENKKVVEDPINLIW